MEIKKVGTPECQLFVAAHYAQSKIDTNAKDWVLEKKYKNFNDYTCRDFYNAKINERAIVIAEPKKDRYELKVIENASFQHYLKKMSEGPLFYYVPVVTTDGLVFYFEKAVNFDATGVLDKKRDRQHSYLIKKLESLFKQDEIVSFNNDMIIMFPLFENYSLEEIIKKLETNDLAYNDKIYPLLNKETYLPFKIDPELYIYSFPEDEKLVGEKIVDKIFAIVSTRENLENKDYTRIYKLMQMMSLEDLNKIKDIVISFKVNDYQKLKDLIDVEVNNKENKILLNRIYK